MEEDILKYSATVMFRGPPCMFTKYKTINTYIYIFTLGIVKKERYIRNVMFYIRNYILYLYLCANNSFLVYPFFSFFSMDSLDGGKHENNKKGKYIKKVLYSLGPSSPPTSPLPILII